MVMHHTMEAYGGHGNKVHAILTLERDGLEWSASPSGPVVPTGQEAA